MQRKYQQYSTYDHSGDRKHLYLDGGDHHHTERRHNYRPEQLFGIMREYDKPDDDQYGQQLWGSDVLYNPDERSGMQGIGDHRDGSGAPDTVGYSSPGNEDDM